MRNQSMPKKDERGKFVPGHIELRPCEQCKEVMEPRFWKSAGRREAPYQYTRRRFCSNHCHHEYQRAHSTRKPEAEVCDQLRHERAREICPKGPCRDCGAPGIMVHHRDLDDTNNDPVNLERLCRFCHGSLHKRMEIGIRRLAERWVKVLGPEFMEFED